MVNKLVPQDIVPRMRERETIVRLISHFITVMVGEGRPVSLTHRMLLRMYEPLGHRML